MTEHELAIVFWRVLIGQAAGLAALALALVWSADRKLKNGRRD